MKVLANNCPVINYLRTIARNTRDTKQLHASIAAFDFRTEAWTYVQWHNNAEVLTHLIPAASNLFKPVLVILLITVLKTLQIVLVH